MTKQTQLFLSADDEAAFSRVLQGVRPRLVFVDGSRWETPVPPLADTIATCTSWWVFLWDQSIVTPFLGLSRKDGRYDGVPDKQIMAAMEAFVADVWKVLKKITQPVVAVDPITGNVIDDSVPEFRAGHDAAAWESSAPDHYMRARSTQHLFRPKTPA